MADTTHAGKGCSEHHRPSGQLVCMLSILIVLYKWHQKVRLTGSCDLPKYRQLVIEKQNYSDCFNIQILNLLCIYTYKYLAQSNK